MFSLPEIQNIVEGIGCVINAPISELLTFGISRDDGTPCIQIERDIYYYLSHDRNTTSFQKPTRDVNELLFWVFKDITHYMAFEYASKNGVKNYDSRRISFPHQIELLSQLDANWARMAEKEIDEILNRFPYHDLS